MKYSAFSLLVAAALIMLAAWFQSGRDLVFSGLPARGGELSELTRQLSISPERLQTLRRARGQLERLRAMPAERGLAGLPTLIDPRPQAVQDRETVRDLPSAPALGKIVSRKDYELSMVLVGPDEEYAVIDGLFRQVGDRMPDGAEVVTIRKGLVQLRDQHGLRNLRIGDKRNLRN